MTLSPDVCESVPRCNTHQMMLCNNLLGKGMGIRRMDTVFGYPSSLLKKADIRQQFELFETQTAYPIP